jgi:eukaryotic-like serine/threonine-protein kinase
MEYPVGKLLVESDGCMSHARISPNGDLVAFADHPTRGDDMGYLAVSDLGGNKKVLTPRWSSTQGVTWFADGKEIWFTAADTGNLRALFAVTPSGRLRLVLRQAITLTLQDISSTGRVLLSVGLPRREIHMVLPGADEERDLSWLDWSLCMAVSADGELVLINEQGQGAGLEYAIYLRPTDGSPAMNVGKGTPADLSADGKSVLVITTSTNELVLLPTGAGDPRKLADEHYNVGWAAFLRDGKRIVFSAIERGRRSRVYVMNVEGGSPRALTPEGFFFDFFSHGVTPGGGSFAARSGDGHIWMFDVEEGPGRPVPGTSTTDNVAGVSPDGRSLYIYGGGQTRVKIYRVDMISGARQAVRETGPADAAGVITVGQVVSSAEGRSYVYSYARLLTDLFLVDGLK